MAISEVLLSVNDEVATKYRVLLALVVQNSSLVVLLRWSRIAPSPKYVPSTAVVLSEALKCLICLCIQIRERRRTPYSQRELLSNDTNSSTCPASYSRETIWSEVFSVESGFFKVLIPAIVYALQNNLQFVAAGHLDAATLQVTYQCKILATAFFTVLLQRRSLSPQKCLSGVACIQTYPSSTTVTVRQGNDMVGFIVVIVACICSGFAEVCFEKVLKKNPRSSIWVRNVQMSVGCFAVAIVRGLIWDGQTIYEHGFFHGYSRVVFATVFVQAAGGIVAALVVKYADSILKGFATSISIVLSTLASIPIFNFVPTTHFVFGSTLVLGYLPLRRTRRSQT